MRLKLSSETQNSGILIKPHVRSVLSELGDVTDVTILDI